MRLYLIVNHVNAKMYVGITSRTVAERWAEHCQDARLNGKRTLSRAIRKYGPEAFTITEVDCADSWADLCLKEKDLIATLETQALGYNMTGGGDGAFGLSPEIVARITAQNRGRKLSEETKRKIGDAGKGRVVSPETRAKISAGHKGKILSPEHRAKLAAAKLGKKRPPRTAEHSRKIGEGRKRAWARAKAND